MAKEMSLKDGYELWLKVCRGRTREFYLYDLQDLADFLHEGTPYGAVRRLVAGGPAGAFERLQQWQIHMRESDLKVTTRNRRLAALSSCLKFLRALGLCPFGVPLRREKVVTDLRPKILPLDVLARMMSLATVRDRVILWLLYDPALRVAEVCSLNLADVDFARRLVSFVGKDRQNAETHDLPDPALEALRAWLAIRGEHPGALFTSNRDPGKVGHRIVTRHVYRIVRDLAAKCGLKGVGPHHLRHTGVTQAARELDGDMPKVQEFARHSSIITSAMYVHLAEDSRRATVDAVAGALQNALAHVESATPEGSPVGVEKP